MNNASIYNSQAATILAPGEIREVPAAGLAGIPSVASGSPPGVILATVVARDWVGTAGSVSIYNPDLGPNGTSTLTWSGTYNYGSGPQQTSAAVSVSVDGTVAIKNDSASVPVHVQLIAQGWFNTIREDVPGDNSPPTDAADPGPLCTGPDCEPRMVAGVASSPVADVQAFAVPLASDSLSVVGSTADYLLLDGATTTINGAGFEVGVSPSDIPAGYANSEGVVDVRVSVRTSNSSVEIGTASVQAVSDPTDPTQTVWANPISVTTSDPAAASVTRATGASAATIANGVSSTVSPASTDGTVVPIVANMVQVEPLASSARSAGSTSAAAVFPPPTSGCTDSFVQNKEVPSVIGTAYPISGVTGNFTVTKSTGGEYGIAGSINGTSGWVQTGVKFKKNTGWSSSFSPSGAQRSFRVQMLYKKYKTVCYLGGYKSTNYAWRVIDEAGTTTEQVGIERPNFGNCFTQAANTTWSRVNSSGSNYSASGGVKFLGVIGVDLSTERSYAASSKLTYKMGSKSVWLCGSNAVPASASKVMVKKK